MDVATIIRALYIIGRNREERFVMFEPSVQAVICTLRCAASLIPQSWTLWSWIVLIISAIAKRWFSMNRCGTRRQLGCRSFRIQEAGL
jgi:hypothetical protein